MCCCSIVSAGGLATGFIRRVLLADNQSPSAAVLLRSSCFFS
jgi:hypothetical protein